MKVSFIGISAIALSFAGLAPQILFAGPIARYVWSDSQGFVATNASCQIRQEDQVPFFISQFPNSQLNGSSKLKGLGFFGGLIQGNLLDRSIITTKDDPKARAKGKARIYVVSVPRNATRPESMKISKAGDEGHLGKESLQDISNFVIEVLEYPGTQKNTLPKPPFKVPKSFWQATTDNEKLITLSCGDAAKPVHYMLFDVYDSTIMDPVAQVGLKIDETNIFRSINVYTPDEANFVVSGEDPAPKPPATPGAGGADSTGGLIPPPETNPVPPPTVEGSDNSSTSEGILEYVICTADKTTAVLDKDLKTNVFMASQFATVVPSQSWDEKQKTTHLEVQFPDREEAPNSGWIPRSLVQLRNDCALLKKERPSEEDTVVDDVLSTLDAKISRKDCCKFPTIKRSSESYTGGILQFRAKRNNGRRLHAGCDLYRKKGEPAVAVASGTIIRGMYYFYQGVFALEVKHPKFIARYGEVLGRSPKGIAKGRNVVAGQAVGYIGKVNSGCCTPMLHFELYRGTSHGSLSRYRLPPYDRRSDVMNPTSFLRQWEKTQFGRSY